MPQTDTKHLRRRGHTWSYVRRIPSDIHHDSRGEPGSYITIALHSDSLEEARRLRNDLVRRDDMLWAAMRQLQLGEKSPAAYARIFKEMGIKTLPKYPEGENATTGAGQMFDDLSARVLELMEERIRKVHEPGESGDRARLKAVDDLVDRMDLPEALKPHRELVRETMKKQVLSGELQSPIGFDAIIDEAFHAPTQSLKKTFEPLKQHYLNRIDTREQVSKKFAGNTAMGIRAGMVAAGEHPTIEVTSVDCGKTVKEALAYYLEVISHDELEKKSDRQRARFINERTRHVRYWVERFGDGPLYAITREQAKTYRDDWTERVKRGEIGADTPRKAFQILRTLFDAIARDDQREDDVRNPFRGISFQAPEVPDVTIPVHTLKAKWLNPVYIKRLDTEWRHPLFVLLETGCRPSEVLNLTGERIRLDHEVPHIRIAPYTSGPRKAQIKTKTSKRSIPLVGIALEVMRMYPEGFDMFDKAAEYSDHANDQLRAAGVLEEYENEDGVVSQQTLRHLRDGYIDRLRDGGINPQVATAITGHGKATGTAQDLYGTESGLALKLEAMESIALPFDPSII